MSKLFQNLSNKFKAASIGHNTAAVKPFWVKVRRAPKGCPFDSKIVVDGMHLANPAGIIYECLTNGEWGMAGAASNIDAGSFTDAAATLKAEGFGMALLWHRQESIEEFIGAVLNHIDASLSLDPFTGKFRIKLIRGDYDPDSLPVFGPHNATLRTFNRKAWGETKNEINVSWTNPANEQEETVTVHDTANISLQGGVVISETMDFTGIRTAELALRVATRELQSASTALATAELVANRSAWKLLPGDVISLQWGPYQFESIPMRVTNVDYGKPGDSAITLTLIEDVFGMPDQSYVSSDGSAWVDPAIDPVVLAHAHVTSAPYYAIVLRTGEAAAEAVPDTSAYDITFGTHPLQGVFNYDLMVQATDLNGNTDWISRRVVGPAGRGELTAALPREVESLVPDMDNLMRGENFSPGALVWIGPINQTGEMCVIRSATEAGHTLGRGVLDTIPKEWPTGTPVWALHGGVLGSTAQERSIGETAAVRMLTNTAAGQLDISAAPTITGVMNDRMHRPYRPGNLRAGGYLWPDPGWYPTYPVTITWAGRNRLSETTVVNRWDAGSVTPETGTDYRVLVEAIQEDGTVDGTVVDTTVTSESYNLDDTSIPSALAGSPFMRVTVTARRGGLTSWQSPSIRFRGPFRAPTGLFVTYRDPQPPTGLSATVLP